MGSPHAPRGVRKRGYLDVVQLVARSVWGREIAGSNPVIQTMPAKGKGSPRLPTTTETGVRVNLRIMEVNVSLLNDQFFCAGFVDIWRSDPIGENGKFTAFVRYDADKLHEVYRVDVKRFGEALAPDIDPETGLEFVSIDVFKTAWGWTHTVYRAKKVLPV